MTHATALMHATELADQILSVKEHDREKLIAHLVEYTTMLEYWILAPTPDRNDPDHIDVAKMQP